MQPDNTRQQISVIIPIYNGEEWLHDALKSLQSQSHQNFEAIMVNDGSFDKSEEICKFFCDSDSRFHLLSQNNGGVSSARNTGLDNAHGKWIAFMDSDDTMAPDALETLVSLAEESGAGIVAGSYIRGVNPQQTKGNDQHITLSSEEAIMLGLYQKRILNSPCGILFSSYVFNGDNPLRFRKCRYEDLDLFYKAFERVDSICITNKIVYFYRDNPKSFINTWSDARLDVLDVTDRIADYMTGRSPALFRAAQDRRFSAHFNMLVEMERYGIEDNEQRGRCLRVIKEQRLNELIDPKVRIKNKLGALISYLGEPAIRMLCKLSR